MSIQTVSTEGTHDERATHDTERPTPLPKFQISIDLLIQFAEPIMALVIYPFVNQFVRKTGTHVLIFCAGIFFAEAFTVIQWGYLSDRFGRRPVLLLAPLGLAASMLSFSEP
jgi:MFS family permease